MKYYFVAELSVTRRDWVRDYVRHVTRMVEAHGGRYLTRTTDVEALEGADAAGAVCLVIEWPSREAAMAFYAGDAYRPYRRARLAGSTGRLLLLPGVDVNGVANVS